MSVKIYEIREIYPDKYSLTNTTNGNMRVFCMIELNESRWRIYDVMDGKPDTYVRSLDAAISLAFIQARQFYQPPDMPSTPAITTGENYL